MNHYIGRNAQTRGRVFVEINRTASMGAIGHDEPRDVIRVSISGTEYAFRTNMAVSAGQNRDVLNDIDTSDSNWNPEDVASLAAIWDRWHLNDLRAYCPHMDVSGLGLSYDERKHVACPETGERYGSAWWAEAVPVEVMRELDRLEAIPGK